MVRFLKHRSFWVVLAVLCLSAMPAWCGTKSIAKNNTNVRSGPGFKHTVIYQAPLGYPVEVLSKQKKWVKVRDWEGITGWVYEPLLSEVRTAVVLSEHANVRTEPSIRSSLQGKVAKGEIYLVLSQDSNWTQIGYYFEKERLGWIRDDLVFGD